MRSAVTSPAYTRGHFLDHNNCRDNKIWLGYKLLEESLTAEDETVSIQSADSGVAERAHQPWLAAHRIVLAIIWSATVVAIVAMLVQDVRTTEQHSVTRRLLHGAYVAALLWHLTRSGPSADALPDIPQLVFPHWAYGRLLPVIGMAFLLALTILSDGGLPILMLLLIVATAWTLVALRRQIRFRGVVLGLLVAVIAFLGGIPFWTNGFVSKPVFVGLLVFVPPMFIAGGLLVTRSGLGEFSFKQGNTGKRCRAFYGVVCCSFPWA